MPPTYQFFFLFLFFASVLYTVPLGPPHLTVRYIFASLVNRDVVARDDVTGVPQLVSSCAVPCFCSAPFWPAEEQSKRGNSAHGFSLAGFKLET